ncbi:MAG TPA: sigma-70 family RNA polymerase sigma factor [Alphaproteobacteria bacterium]|nr:sigma-70 family RNA polymerase sigma factor [Alphaproteobacteria bacterium]
MSAPNVDLYSFDEAYLCRLQASDPATEAHFVSYFSELLRIKLRSRMLAPQAMEDVRQETFYRVLVGVRTENAIRSPERLGAYVNAVCNNILLESYRSAAKRQHLDVDTVEVRDPKVDLEGMMLRQERKAMVREVLARLPERDQNCLRALFLEDRDKDEICADFGVDRNYLRVLLHRAKNSFRAHYNARKTASRLGRAAGS